MIAIPQNDLPLLRNRSVPVLQSYVQSRPSPAERYLHIAALFILLNLFSRTVYIFNETAITEYGSIDIACEN